MYGGEKIVDVAATRSKESELHYNCIVVHFVRCNDPIALRCVHLKLEIEAFINPNTERRHKPLVALLEVQYVPDSAEICMELERNRVVEVENDAAVLLVERKQVQVQVTRRLHYCHHIQSDASVVEHVDLRVAIDCHSAGVCGTVLDEKHGQPELRRAHVHKRRPVPVRDVRLLVPHQTALVPRPRERHSTAQYPAERQRNDLIESEAESETRPLHEIQRGNAFVVLLSVDTRFEIVRRYHLIVC